MIFKQSSYSNSNRTEFIDGLKGVAVLMVIWHHCLPNFHHEFQWPYFKDLIFSGFRGVPLFFIISAFTIFNSSLTRFEIDSRPVLSFYLRRSFRILPFYWLNLLYEGYRTSFSWKQILANATFLFGFTDFNDAMLLGAWSLFVEEVFYISFPLFFYKFYKKKSWAIYFFIVAILVKTCWYQWSLVTGSPALSDLNYIYSPFAHFFWFYIGILLAHFKITENNDLQNSLLFDQLAILGILTMGFMDEFTGAFFLCFLIYLASFKNTFVGKICRSKLLGRVGISCYSIYFLHFTVIRNVNTLLDNNFYSSYFLAASTELKFLFYGIIVTLISIFVGRISFHLIEVPSVKIGSYFISKINAKKALPSEVEIPEAVETP